MQLMIDTAADTTTLMRRAAQFLITEADARDADESGLVHPLKIIPAPLMLPTRETAPVIDTAAVFAKAQAPAPLAPLPPVVLPLAPPPPVAPIAPAPPVASAGVSQLTAGPVERDSTGLSYDARIHQTARGKKRDGAWKNQKGIDPDMVKLVEAELRGQLPGSTAPLPPVTQVAPPPPAAAVATQPAPMASVAAPIPSGDTPATDFRKLMQTITSGTNSGKLTNDEVDAALKSVGLPARQLISLMQNPDKVQGVGDYIAAVLAAKG